MDSHIIAAIGDILRKARIQKGLEIDDIVSELHIKREYIEAIEKGDIKTLPSSEIYVRGYVSRYANLLKIRNPFDIVEEREVRQDKTTSDECHSGKKCNSKGGTSSPQRAPAFYSLLGNKAESKKRLMSYGKAVIISVVAIILAAIAISGYKEGETKSSDKLTLVKPIPERLRKYENDNSPKKYDNIDEIIDSCREIIITYCIKDEIDKESGGANYIGIIYGL